MSAGFQYAGQRLAGAPIITPMQIGETVYVGQLLQSGLVGGAGGHVQIADAASEAHENDQPIIGMVGGVITDGVYSATYYGDGCTYDTTLADVLANTPKDAAQVAVVRIIPDVTLVRAPIYNGAYGTALTVLTETSGDATGVTVTHSGEAITDIADDFATIYCRTGANRGLYRVVTTVGTGTQVVTVPFPYAIAVGDTFVVASCVLGLGGLDIPATANCIDGNAALTNYYDVEYHTINLEEAGKEFAVLSFKSKACGPIGA